jgi:hypothetical protein
MHGLSFLHRCSRRSDTQGAREEDDKSISSEDLKQHSSHRQIIALIANSTFTLD